jgi:hypothetical protein
MQYGIGYLFWYLLASFAIIPIFDFPFSLTTPFGLVFFHNAIMQLLSRTVLLLRVNPAGQGEWRLWHFLFNRNTSVSLAVWVKMLTRSTCIDLWFQNELNYVRFEIFTAVAMKNAVFWDVALCRSCVNWRLGGTYRLRLQGRKIRDEKGTQCLGV